MSIRRDYLCLPKWDPGLHMALRDALKTHNIIWWEGDTSQWLLKIWYSHAHSKEHSISNLRDMGRAVNNQHTNCSFQWNKYISGSVGINHSYFIAHRELSQHEKNENKWCNNYVNIWMCCVNICVYVYVMGRERFHIKTKATTKTIEISTIKQP